MPIDAHGTVLSLIGELLTPSAQAADVQAEVKFGKDAVPMHLDEVHQVGTKVGIKEIADGPAPVAAKATTPEAKAFAQRVIDDHGAALARVQALAAKLGLAPRASQESQDKQIEGAIDDQILNRPASAELRSALSRYRSGPL